MTSIRSKSLFDIYLKFKKNRGEKKKKKKNMKRLFVRKAMEEK